MECVQPGQVFEVPRTALLLTGSVRSLLPLPAEFHLRREHSAPASSIKATANGSAADRVNGSSGSLQELGRSGSSELLLSPKRQGSGSDSGSSSPKGSSPRGGSPGASVANLAAILEHPAHDQQQHDVVAHEVAAEAQAKEQQQQQQDDARVLASPAELPPGDFSCLTEAMLLQVPRGFQMPTDLQTTTYQAQVLSKGSISVGVSGSAASGAAAERGLAGGAASAYSAGELRRHSKLVSPLAKSMGGMLARVSRLAGISRTASDSMPQMPFLQTALASMREQQQERARQDNMRRSSGGTAAAAAAVRGYPLRSVAEREAGVRLSNESPAASGAAAAPAAGAAGDIEMGVPETALGAAGGSSQPSPFAAAARNSSNGTTPAAVNAAGAGLSRLGQQQQQQGVVMPRATDVVTGSRAEGRQAGGGSAGGILLSSNSLTRRSTGSLT